MQQVDGIAVPLGTEGAEVLALHVRLMRVAHTHMVPAPVEDGVRRHDRPFTTQRGPGLGISGQFPHGFGATTFDRGHQGRQCSHQCSGTVQPRPELKGAGGDLGDHGKSLPLPRQGQVHDLRGPAGVVSGIEYRADDHRATRCRGKPLMPRQVVDPLLSGLAGGRHWPW